MAAPGAGRQCSGTALSLRVSRLGAVFLALPFPRGAAREVPGCLGCAAGTGTVGGRAGDVPWLGSPGWSRIRSCPSVSSQLAAAAKPSFHRLPKAAGVIRFPPWPLILTFIILRAVPALPSVFGIAESGVGSSVGLRLHQGAQTPPRGSALPPPGTSSPQMFSGLRGWAARAGRQLGQQWVNPQGCGRCPLEPGEDVWASWKSASCT